MKKVVVLTLAAITVSVVMGLALMPGAGATPPGNENNITICHGTSAVNNPYTVITVDTSGTGGQQQLFGPQGHASHTGAIFNPATNVNGDAWGDIIPPFPDPDGAGPFQGFAGLNWTAGQTINEAGCVVAVPTTPPPVLNPTASLTTPTCPNPNIVATGVNPTNAPVTFDVFIDGVLVDSFIVAANSTGTSASIPVTNTDVVTVTVQGSQTVLDTETVNLNCVTTTPPVVTTPPPVVTTPPPVVTTPPPVVTTPPPAGGGNPPPGPGGNPNPPPHNPPNAPVPNKLAFTGPEQALPIGALAGALASAGTGLLVWGRKRRKNDEYQEEHFPSPPS